MPSTISKRTTPITRVKQSLMHVPRATVKNAPKTAPELRRWLKSMGAVPMTREMKRRLLAAGEWGMPKE